jgi:hypothetical protein
MSQGLPGNSFPGGPSPDAAAKVSGPAIGLIIVGALNAAMGAYNIFQGAMGANAQIQAPPEMQGDQQAMEMFETLQNLGGGTAIAVGVITALVGLLIIFGGLKMKNLQSYGLAMTASVLALIPCVSPSACCLIGIGIGIWSLIVLMKPEVKAAFGR